jgi:D-tyrosyl-tRNA(Tyr) deacylase
MMSVALTNEGPVTLTIDSRKFEYVQPPPPSAKGQKSTARGTKTGTGTPKVAQASQGAESQPKQTTAELSEQSAPISGV